MKAAGRLGCRMGGRIVVVGSGGWCPGEWGVWSGWSNESFGVLGRKLKWRSTLENRKRSFINRVLIHYSCVVRP